MSRDLTKKEILFTLLILASPMIFLGAIFGFGKLLVYARQAELQGDGIPTSITEYNKKYYPEIPASENAANTLLTAFANLKDWEGTPYTDDDMSPVLNQELNDFIYKKLKDYLKNSTDLEKALNKLYYYTKARFYPNYDNYVFRSFSFEFWQTANYHAVITEVMIHDKKFDDAVKILKRAFHVNKFSTFYPCTINYHLNDFDENNTVLLKKLLRLLSMTQLSERDLEDFVDIIDCLEEISTKQFKKHHLANIVFCFELTDKYNLNYYFHNHKGVTRSFFNFRRNLLTNMSYHSGINSFDAINAVDTAESINKLSLKPYKDIVGKLHSLNDDSQSIFEPLAILESEMAKPHFFREKYQAIALMRCVKTACAVELYRLKYKKIPETIDELAPEFISEIPTDIFDGEPLKYKTGEFQTNCVIYTLNDTNQDIENNLTWQKANKNGYRIYSIGADLVDNKGDMRSYPISPVDLVAAVVTEFSKSQK